ncbi:hypothetical protein [Nitratireductor luteus]|uniref:hypothetical protein n=1 Tax=Nitratireductor luteus TaxID=2976980 RepID=UPI00223ECDDA|nr:hypothetical protein [Nitratireductor luteus]
MRRAYLLLALFSAGPAAAGSLIGAEVPPYPDGFSSSMGACIPDGRDICGYSIGTLENAEGDVIAIIAEQKTRMADRQPLLRVLDMIDTPALTDRQAWAIGECEIDGRLEPTVAGIVNVKDTGGWIEAADTIWAVRFDPAVGKLRAIDTARVTCAIPGS